MYLLKNLLIIILLSGCALKATNNSRQINYFKYKISNYNCEQMQSEMYYINKNLDFINQKLNNGLSQYIMESIVSMGIYTMASKRNLQKNKELFEEKINLIQKKQKLQNCYE